MKRILAQVALATTIILAGCAPGRPHPMGMGPTTLGQQLIDLKEAHNRGALTDQEYADAKAKELKLLAEHGEADEYQSCGCGDGKGPGCRDSMGTKHCGHGDCGAACGKKCK